MYGYMRFIATENVVRGHETSYEFTDELIIGLTCTGESIDMRLTSHKRIGRYWTDVQPNHDGMVDKSGKRGASNLLKLAGRKHRRPFWCWACSRLR